MGMTKLLSATVVAGGLMVLTAGGLMVVGADDPKAPPADPPKPTANSKPAKSSEPGIGGISAGLYTGVAQFVNTTDDGMVTFINPLLTPNFIEIEPDGHLRATFLMSLKENRFTNEEKRVRLSVEKTEKAILYHASVDGATPTKMVSRVVQDAGIVWNATIDGVTYRVHARPFSSELFVFQQVIDHNGKPVLLAQEFYAIKPRAVAAQTAEPAPTTPAPKAMKDWTAEEVATEFRKRVLAGEIEKASELCNPVRLPESHLRRMAEGGSMKPAIIAVTASDKARIEAALLKERAIQDERRGRQSQPQRKPDPEMFAILDKVNNPNGKGEDAEYHLILVLRPDGKENQWRVSDMSMGSAKYVKEFLSSEKNEKPDPAAIAPKAMKDWTAEEVATEFRRRVLAGEFEEARVLCNLSRVPESTIRGLAKGGSMKPAILAVTASETYRQQVALLKEQAIQDERRGRLPQPRREPNPEMLAILDKVSDVVIRVSSG